MSVKADTSGRRRVGASLAAIAPISGSVAGFWVLWEASGCGRGAWGLDGLKEKFEGCGFEKSLLLGAGAGGGLGGDAG